MSPEQITEQLNEIIEHIADAYILLGQLHRDMGLEKPAAERNVVVEDIWSDMVLGPCRSDLRDMEKQLVRRLETYLPEHFERLRAEVKS